MTFKVSTPLRYPGGKSVFTDYFQAYIEINHIQNVIYAEPYCGGAGAAINLLLKGSVSKIILNDANFSIYAFWYSLKYLGNEFINLFETTEVTLIEWKKQREIFKNSKANTDNESILKLGFATFFLNRCNRSGILTAGPIGGQSEIGQANASSKISARYNKSALRVKINKIIDKRDQIIVTNLDALSFLKLQIETQPEIDLNNTFVYLDPPYFKQGSSLYMNYYKQADHRILAEYLNECLSFHWILSYDNVAEIRELYRDFVQYSFYLNYSAQHSKLGCELLVSSRQSILPASNIIRTTENNKTVELNRL